MKAAFRFNLCLLFAYPSLIVRSSFAQCIVKIGSKKWHKNCDTISKMFGLTL